MLIMTALNKAIELNLLCSCHTHQRVLISSTGSNVLLLRNNLSCGVHLLFALLCGRPVVVLAEPRNERFVRFTLQLIATV